MLKPILQFKVTTKKYEQRVFILTLFNIYVTIIKLRYSERFDIPLLNAYITEILRHSSFVPFTLPHTSAKDTTINGYLIPQGASIMVSFMSLNWDSNVWENPDLFR